MQRYSMTSCLGSRGYDDCDAEMEEDSQYGDWVKYGEAQTIISVKQQEIANLIKELQGCEPYTNTGEKHMETLATSGNYTANDEIYPTEVKFNNGRIVRLVEENGKYFLEVGQLNVVSLRPLVENKAVVCHSCGVEIWTA